MAPAGSGALDQFLAAEKPDRLHIEAMDFFGNYFWASQHSVNTL